MKRLDSVLFTLSQASSNSTSHQRPASIVSDISNIVSQWNTALYPILITLIPDLALTYGLSGHSIKTNSDATKSSPKIYWNSTNKRASSIKESFDVVISEMVRIENLITKINQSTETVNLSDINLDSTIPISAVADLDVELDEIRDSALASEFISPLVMKPVGPTTSDEISIGTYPTDDIVYPTINYVGSADGYAYLHSSIPLSLTGVQPKNVRVTAYVVTAVASPAATAKACTFNLAVNNSAGAEDAKPIAELSLGNPTWSSLGIQTSSLFTIPDDTNKVKILEWTFTIEQVSGLVPLRLSRVATDASDTYGDDVSLVGVRINWYR
jgi:hypothetical protein